MKQTVAFFHDHRFAVLDSGVWSSGQFPASTWKRYLTAFEQVRVTARKAAAGLDGSGGWDLSSAAGVDFSVLEESIWFPPKGRRIAKETVRREVENADAVIARLPSELGLLATKAAAEMGKPWAVEVVGCPWDAYMNYGGAAPKLYAPIACARMKHAVAKAPYAIYVSKKFLQRRYPCGGVTENASNVWLPCTVEKSRDYRERRKECEVFSIGFIGSLEHRYKGLHVLLKALGSVKEQVGPVKLRVLGKGAGSRWHEEVEKHGLQDCVFLEGTLPAGEAVLEWLDEIDLFVQPSFQEGLPRTVLEAMSRGVASLGSTVGGIPELLSEEALHKPGDWRTLARQILFARTNPNWCEMQSANNIETAKDYLDSVLRKRRSAFWWEFAEWSRSGVVR